MTKVISFSSGKGGVGKTTLVGNLGHIYAARGYKTLLVDGDWALGKLSVTLGVRPQWTVEKVLEGKIKLQDAIQTVTPNLSLLASPSGVVGFEEMTEMDRTRLYYELEQLGGRYDRILFDHASGLSWGVLQFAAACHQHVVVTTPEPTSYTDAYAIMKLLSKRFAIRDFGLLVTSSYSPNESEKIIARFMDVARSHLDIRLQVLDILPWEPKVAESVRKRQAFVSCFPTSDLTKRLEKIADQLEAMPVANSNGLHFFYETQLTAR